jgi:hypothetical protein
VGELHRIGLEVEVEREIVELEPAEWDLDDLMRTLSAGTARVARIVRGRVVDEEHDLLSTTLEGIAADVADVVQLHWLSASSPAAVIQPAPGAPRPSLETLVELRGLEEQLRRMVERLRAERL